MGGGGDQFSCLRGYFEESEALHIRDSWPCTYQQMVQVPKYWLCSWLTSCWPTLTLELLQAVDKSGKNGLRNLVEYVVGVRQTTKLPRIVCDFVSCYVMFPLVPSPRLAPAFWSSLPKSQRARCILCQCTNC